MKTIKNTLILVLAGVALVSCKQKDATASRDTAEKLTAAYEEAQAVGVDEVMKLVYKADQIPEKMQALMRESMAGTGDLKIKSITTEPFEDANFDASVEAMKKMGMMMPVKPTHYMKVVYEPEGELSGATESLPIAKVDGSFYLIAPITAK